MFVFILGFPFTCMFNFTLGMILFAMIPINFALFVASMKIKECRVQRCIIRAIQKIGALTKETCRAEIVFHLNSNINSHQSNLMCSNNYVAITSFPDRLERYLARHPVNTPYQPPYQPSYQPSYQPPLNGNMGFQQPTGPIYPGPYQNNLQQDFSNQPICPEEFSGQFYQPSEYTDYSEKNCNTGNECPPMYQIDLGHQQKYN